MQRRELIGAFGATALAIHQPAVLASLSEASTSEARRLYQRIARGRVLRLAGGLRDRQQILYALHHQLPQVIEQNLAALDPVAMAMWVDSVEEALWPMLAACYQAAITDAGQPHVLADLLTLNLDLERLARLAPHFGVQVLEPAVARWRPAQLAAFQGLAAGSPARVDPIVTNSGPPIEYTLREIYLSYRTAPIGALGVRAALYQTAHFAGGHLSVALGTGMAIGSALAPLVQHFAPGLWNNIGASVHWAVTQYQAATTPRDRGAIQHATLPPFDVGSGAYFGLTTTGGDYLVVEELPLFITGGGTICWECSPHRGAGR